MIPTLRLLKAIVALALALPVASASGRALEPAASDGTAAHGVALASAPVGNGAIEVLPYPPLPAHPAGSPAFFEPGTGGTAPLSSLPPILSAPHLLRGVAADRDDSAGTAFRLPADRHDGFLRRAGALSAFATSLPPPRAA